MKRGGQKAVEQYMTEMGPADASEKPERISIYRRTIKRQWLHANRSAKMDVARNASFSAWVRPLNEPLFYKDATPEQSLALLEAYRDFVIAKSNLQLRGQEEQRLRIITMRTHGNMDDKQNAVSLHVESVLSAMN
jgi:hypothetical protein